MEAWPSLLSLAHMGKVLPICHGPKALIFATCVPMSIVRWQSGLDLLKISLLPVGIALLRSGLLITPSVRKSSSLASGTSGRFNFKPLKFSELCSTWFPVSYFILLKTGCALVFAKEPCNSGINRTAWVQLSHAAWSQIVISSAKHQMKNLAPVEGPCCLRNMFAFVCVLLDLCK